MFIGILFAQRLHDVTVLLPVSILFAAFCMASSAVYLFNDVRDRHEDALHPVKRHRPIAAGKVSPRTALALAAILAGGALLVSALPRPVPGSRVPPGLVALGSYLLINLAYTSKLKTIAIADVTCVALGFLIRVVSGPAVAGLVVSPWLILCTFFGSLFLASAKRRGEMFATENEGSGRAVLSQYSAAVLDLLVGQTATATLVCYAIYTVSDQTVEKFGSTHMLYTIPIAFFGLGRYLILLYKRGEGEDPAALLFRDPGILAAIVSWVIVSALVIGIAPH